MVKVIKRSTGETFEATPVAWRGANFVVCVADPYTVDVAVTYGPFRQKCEAEDFIETHLAHREATVCRLYQAERVH